MSVSPSLGLCRRPRLSDIHLVLLCLRRQDPVNKVQDRAQGKPLTAEKEYNRSVFFMNYLDRA